MKKNGVDGVDGADGADGVNGVMGLMGRMRGEKHYESDCFSGAMPLQGDLFSFFITPSGPLGHLPGEEFQWSQGGHFYIVAMISRDF